MGNQCKGSEETKLKIFESSQKLIEFVCETIIKFLQVKVNQQDQKELQNLLKFVKSINPSQQTQVLENDHFISLNQISSRQKKKMKKKFSDQLNELGKVNLQESMLILNQYNLCLLQFQELYNSINTLEQHQVNQCQVLKNKQLSDNNKEIICEKHLYQMFTRISNKKFIIFLLIDYWITTLKSKNLKLIIDLATVIMIEIYDSMKEIIIPERIFQILIQWMVQVIVFNLCNSTVEINKHEHLLDFIFYYKCPIEKMMILLAQQNVLRIQYVMRDSDDLADSIDKLLRQYPRANLLKHEIQLIEEYVNENWFITLYHIVKTWSVIAKRF